MISYKSKKVTPWQQTFRLLSIIVCVVLQLASRLTVKSHIHTQISHCTFKHKKKSKQESTELFFLVHFPPTWNNYSMNHQSNCIQISAWNNTIKFNRKQSFGLTLLFSLKQKRPKSTQNHFKLNIYPYWWKYDEMKCIK